MNCPRCRLKSKPFHETCVHCQAELRSAEEAEAGRKEWDALEPKLRDDLETQHTEQFERLQNRKGWIKDSRLRHVLVGAALFGLPMIIISQFHPVGSTHEKVMNLVWSLLLLIAGGGLGFLLSSIRASNMLGIVFFFVGFILMNLVGMLLGLGLNPAVLMFGMVLMLVAGMGMGMHITNEDLDA